MKEARHQTVYRVIPLIFSSQKRQNYIDGRQNTDLPGARGPTEDQVHRTRELVGLMVGSTLDFGDCCTTVHIYQNSLNHTFKMAAFYNMQNTS